MDDIQSLLAQLAKELPFKGLKPNKTDVLIASMPFILELRRKKYTYDDIAYMLHGKGHNVSTSLIKSTTLKWLRDHANGAELTDKIQTDVASNQSTSTTTSSNKTVQVTSTETTKQVAEKSDIRSVRIPLKVLLDKYGKHMPNALKMRLATLPDSAQFTYSKWSTSRELCDDISNQAALKYNV